VTQKDLFITADTKVKNYGQVIPLTFHQSGLVTANGDSISGVNLFSAGNLASATVAGSPYVITPSSATGSGLSNYNIHYVNGQLFVNKANATVAVSGYNVLYDGLTHTDTGTATGALGENLSAELTLPSGHIGPGYFADTWSFSGDSNYNASSGTVFNVISLPASANNFGGHLIVVGTSSSDSLLVSNDGTNYNVTINGNGAGSFAVGGVTDVEMIGFTGNDTMTMIGLGTVLMFGGGGSDVMNAGTGNTMMFAGSGGATMNGNASGQSVMLGGSLIASSPFYNNYASLANIANTWSGLSIGAFGTLQNQLMAALVANGVVDVLNAGTTTWALASAGDTYNGTFVVKTTTL